MSYSLWDNVKLAAAAVADAANPSNLIALATGADVPGQTSYTAIIAADQLASHGDTQGAANALDKGAQPGGGVDTIAQAAGDTATQAVNDVGDAAKKAGGLLSSGWFWAGVGGLVLAVAVGPYVVPLIRRAA